MSNNLYGETTNNQTEQYITNPYTNNVTTGYTNTSVNKPQQPYYNYQNTTPSVYVYPSVSTPATYPVATYTYQTYTQPSTRPVYNYKNNDTSYSNKSSDNCCYSTKTHCHEPIHCHRNTHYDPFCCTLI